MDIAFVSLFCHERYYSRVFFYLLFKFMILEWRIGTKKSNKRILQSKVLRQYVSFSDDDANNVKIRLSAFFSTFCIKECQIIVKKKKWW